MKKLTRFYKKDILVDDEDFERIRYFNWTPNRIKTRIVLACNIDGKTTSIGRYILNYEGPLEVDHIDGDPWNNQKKNLRLATRSQQMMNSKPQLNRKFKGVHKHKNGKFRVLLKAYGKNVHGGYWTTEKQAAKEYDKLAIEHFGVFAKLNYPKEVKW